MFPFLEQDNADQSVTLDLIQRARGGEDEAYNELFRRMESRLTFYIQFRLGTRLRDQLDEYDVLQEAYLQAHRSFSGFNYQGTGTFCRWLYQIIDHRIRDAAKHAGRKKRRPAKELVRGSNIFDIVEGSVTGPPSACIRSEAHDRLLKAMHDLAQDESEAILLHYFQEQSVTEIVKIMGRSEATIRRILGRARFNLGVALRAQDQSDP
jgi:RNA polymerase sigma-70 factor, ECF subfamily